MSRETKKKLIQTAVFGVPAYEMKPVEEGYRPPISRAHMRRLRLLKLETGRPVTELLAEALDHYFENGGPITTLKGGEECESDEE